MSFLYRKKKGRGRFKEIPLEHEEQANLMQWKMAFLRTYPELFLLHAIPNQGAARLKNLQTEGVCRGVPDLCLPVPRGKYHGCYIELKRQKGNKPSLEQYDWLTRLSEQGYFATVCYGWEAARDMIVNYLEGRA